MWKYGVQCTVDVGIRCTVYGAQCSVDVEIRCTEYSVQCLKDVEIRCTVYGAQWLWKRMYNVDWMCNYSVSPAEM
jgi:hypothetical protein